ncbi:MAG: hypothetical protein Fur0020_15450 [Thermodesulfovibrionia bacterium]
MNNIRYLLPIILSLSILATCKGTVDKGMPEIKVNLRTDAESINKGRELFNSKCAFCHDPNSTNTVVGPGLKGILKGGKLPISKRLATPDNIVRQLKEPYRDMPSFSYLSEDEIENIIAYLNTI